MIGTYQTTVFKAGNSIVTTIPKSLARELNLSPGDTLYSTVTPDGVLKYGKTYAAVTSTHRTRRQRRKS